MTRYFFYFVIVAMLIHTVIFVPRVHIDERFRGAILSFAIGPAIAVVLIAAFTATMRKFKGQGVPEIFAASLPKAVYVPILFVMGLGSLSAGAIVWVHCTFVFAKYLNPDMAPSILLILFVTVTCLAAAQSSKAVMYSTEIIFVLSVPLLLVLLLHGVFSKSLNVDSIRAMLDYTWIPPSWNCLSASTNTFAGFLTLSIFNRLFTEDRKIRYVWAIPFIGFALEILSFFIPIGFHGTDGVDDYIYTWVSTMDAISIKYILIERVISIYLLVSLVITFTYTMFVWHIGAQTIGSCFRAFDYRKNTPLTKLIAFGICALAGIATIVLGLRIDEATLFKTISKWMQIGLPIDLLFVACVYVAGKRLLARRAGS
ncbi:GerAB/ArcD/ProY family transporter [Paenibacillus sp. MWE-103]|uniref:GerAB/ArcD/ProY family transporter n=1 Tax=Paenibacillus artemisiicola TaxID=1172618 RepID=A0ABS3W3J3_9BACL|nr:GerAB/ArcD/ProY family transporter [Paenibacillus artemisiicola]MBO7742766.1 GerAB/ArcD/ProY family transporter [Paenibacillus artemisiicola]